MNFDLLEARRYLAAGDPDPSFGTGGAILYDEDVPADVGDVVAVPGDQFLLAGGENDGRASLRRFNADGSVDETFGEGGAALTQFGNRSASIVLAERTTDGKVVALVKVDRDYAVARFNAEGSIDTTYGDGGDGFSDVTLPVSSSESFAFAVDDQGRALVAIDANVARYTAAGTPDASFGNTGVADDVLGGRKIRALAALSGGGVIAGGGTADETPAAVDPQFLVARLNADGTPDASFGVGGRATTDFGPPDGDEPFETVLHLTVLADGKILATGSATGMAAARYTAAGQADPSFGNDGRIELADFGTGAEATVAADGRIYLSDRFGDVARLTADGDEDDAFGRVAGVGQALQASFNTAGTVLLSTGLLIVPGRVFFLDGGGNAIALVGRLTEDDGVPSPIARDVNGVVNVAGTGGDDRITGGGFDRNLSVALNGFARAFDIDDVTLLRIAAGDGDDHVVLSNIAIVSADVSGGNGRDRISGTSRNDTLRGEGGRDFLDGFTGADYLTGGGGKDQLRGQGGNDRVKGGDGDDYVEGSAGNDRLDGGAGQDFINGMNGNDLLAANEGEGDQIFGGAGSDSVDADDDDVIDGVETIL